MPISGCWRYFLGQPFSSLTLLAGRQLVNTSLEVYKNKDAGLWYGVC
jgi:hypothetical protein